MSLKAVVGQRKSTLFPNSVCFIEFRMNLRFPVCCLGIMQDVIRVNKKPNEWKVSWWCAHYVLVNMFTFAFMAG